MKFDCFKKPGDGKRWLWRKWRLHVIGRSSNEEDDGIKLNCNEGWDQATFATPLLAIWWSLNFVSFYSTLEVLNNCESMKLSFAQFGYLALWGWTIKVEAWGYLAAKGLACSTIWILWSQPVKTCSGFSKVSTVHLQAANCDWKSFWFFSLQCSKYLIVTNFFTKATALASY